MTAAASAAGTVVLLHGLARTPRSMAPLARALRGAGYRVVNIGYPSTRAPVERLVDTVLAPRVAALADAAGAPLHFVTHSMGGVLLRDLARRHRPAGLGRAVMLAPPNRGSELVDRLAWLAPFRWINGPAGAQLGTAVDSLVNRLGPVDFELGVIAGTRALNPLYAALIPGANDGKVAVERTRVEGMSDFLEVARSHTFLMRAPEVQRQVLAFLRDGRFDVDPDRAGAAR